MEDVKPRLTEESNATRIWTLTEISETTQLRSLRLSSMVNVDKVGFGFLTYQEKKEKEKRKKKKPLLQYC